MHAGGRAFASDEACSRPNRPASMPALDHQKSFSPLCLLPSGLTRSKADVLPPSLIWFLFTSSERVGFPGVHGHIPNFLAFELAFSYFRPPRVMSMWQNRTYGTRGCVSVERGSKRAGHNIKLPYYVILQ